jgi:hypothetical protein
VTKREHFVGDEDYLPEDDDDTYGSYDYDHDYWLDEDLIPYVEEDEEEQPFEGGFSWEEWLDKR